MGEGKSIYLSELVKKISRENDGKIRFSTTKKMSIKDVDSLFDDADALVCIDALDEASDDIKKAIKEKFKTFEGRCIVSTRYAESFDPDTKARTLYFNLIETDSYIDSRFQHNPKTATKVKEWLQRQ